MIRTVSNAFTKSKNTQHDLLYSQFKLQLALIKEKGGDFNSRPDGSGPVGSALAGPTFGPNTLLFSSKYNVAF